MRLPLRDDRYSQQSAGNQPMSEVPVIDPQAIENLRALNPGDSDQFLREIAGIFLEDTPQRLSELDESLAGGDAARFTRAAHSIKGSAANLGATALRRAAEHLEQRSRHQGLADVGPLLDTLKAEFGTAAIALQRLIGN